MSHAMLQIGLCTNRRNVFLSLPHHHWFMYWHSCAMIIVWLMFVASVGGSTTTRPAYDSDTECYTQADGSDYEGHVSITETGKTCQKWTSQTPNTHDYTPANYPNSGLGDHNYCRNPGSDEPRAWCYTNDRSYSWEFCFIGMPQTSCKVNVRLVNSYYENEGIIEIKDPFDRTWGPLCGLDLGAKEADVICRQLGFPKLAFEFYSDGKTAYNTYYYNDYGGYVYQGLDCNGDEAHVYECSYDSHRGPIHGCNYPRELFGAVNCHKETDSSISVSYWGLIVIIIVVVAMIHGLRQCGDRRRCLSTCPCSKSTPSQTPQEVLAAANVYPPPPAPSDSTTYHQVPNADLPPGYDACVTPPQSQDGNVPYLPPQGATPYPPPQSDGNGTAYPPASTNPALPPLDTSDNPAFPPPGSYYPPNSDEVPMTPPPSYDSITTSGRFDTEPSDSGGGGGTDSGGGGGGSDGGGGGD